MRFILYSKTDGTFIGSSYGGDFFSKYSGMAFSKTAQTFKSAEEAEKYAVRWKGDNEYPQDVEVLPVQTDQDSATMAECIAAGAMPWESHIAWMKEHPDRTST